MSDQAIGVIPKLFANSHTSRNAIVLFAVVLILGQISNIISNTLEFVGTRTDLQSREMKSLGGDVERIGAKVQEISNQQTEMQALLASTVATQERIAKTLDQLVIVASQEMIEKTVLDKKVELILKDMPTKRDINDLKERVEKNPKVQ